MDRLILTDIISGTYKVFDYPQICMCNKLQEGSYAYFKEPSDTYLNASGFISIPVGWHSELIKGIQ